MVNRRVVLRSRPAHVPQPRISTSWQVGVPEPCPNEVLVRNLYFSIEPAIRARLDDKATYMPPIGIGEPIQSPTVGRVARSNHPEHREGEILFGFNNWDDYVIVTDDTLLLEPSRPRTGCRSPTTSGRSAARARRRTWDCTTSAASRPARPS
jgi:NADPH-dependent curcumin reductase CurA